MLRGDDPFAQASSDVGPSAPVPSHAYDAFISYSHAKDKPVAAGLQTVVQTLGKPWWRLRAARVFRDDTSLAAAPSLWPAIEKALLGSNALILMASPEAAQSIWVDREVSAWLEAKGTGRLFIALTAGALHWDKALGDFEAPAPLPPALRGRLAAEPLWTDLRAFRAATLGPLRRHQDLLASAAKLAAAVRNEPLEDLLSEEVRQQRINLRLARGVTVGFTALAIGASVAAWRAVVERDAAVAEASRNERIVTQVKATADRRIAALIGPPAPQEPKPPSPAPDRASIEAEIAALAAKTGRDAEEQTRLVYDYVQLADIAKGEPDRALAALAVAYGAAKAGVKTWPNDAKLLHDLALICDRQGRALHSDPQAALSKFDEARGWFRKLLDLAPNTPVFARDAAADLELAGEALKSAGQDAAALEALRQALIIRERDTAEIEDATWQQELERAYRRACEALLAAGRTKEAAETAEQYVLAVSLAPEAKDKPQRAARALGTLSWDALNAGEIGDAIKAATRGHDLDPSLDFVAINLAHALMYTGGESVAQARQIYLRPIADPGRRAQWRKSIVEDFQALGKRHGLGPRPLMQEVTEQFKADGPPAKP